MSSPTQTEDDEVDEVEFVSEGPVRPVLECIDLLSEDEGCSSLPGTIEDKLSRHKARVTSTLDRLAHQVAQEKKERIDKCRAFKEKQMSQRAHGQQGLAFSSTNGNKHEAKHCVDMWLNMPGPRPGVINAGFGRRRQPVSFPGNSSIRHTCPVINCGRVYDNTSLLDGHLKRFDHSPCDPTINIKGCPSEIFACIACCQLFHTEETWRQHLMSKVSSFTADGHSITQNYQRIVCFACPACYCLFNLRDECLQHMSAKNHFTESLAMSETKGRPLPVPISQYVKNRLITLCKDATFNVRCSLCHKVLISHQAAQAHFNVHCRQGCAVASADKTIVEVMKQLQVRGQCSICCKIFRSQAEIERHKESTQHDVEVNQTMAKALLQYCRFSELQHKQRTGEAQRKRQATGHETPIEKRNKTKNCEESPAKRKRLSVNGSTSRKSVTAWFCECGIQFSEEATATKHLLAVNRIFHQCGVCGKHMGESSITRLHMSRFHGGAHLSNFLFNCRKCNLEMPRYEDILSHVADAHSGHTYFTQREVPKELDTEPSTSSKVARHSSSMSTGKQRTAETSSFKAEPKWMCRMCEDTFDSEAAARKHCSDVSGHSFQRFICGHCPQKFFKESTVRRHCTNEHDGQIKSSHFCGLCDSMQFETEGEFLEHYKSLHSTDYYCVEDVEVVQPTVAESASWLKCPCMGSEKCIEEMKATYTQCMRDLSAEGKCLYVCAPCGVSVPSYAQMKTHVHTKHAALNLDKTYDVECEACQESFTSVPSFHKHYHSRHCTLEPCMSSRTCSKNMKAEPPSVKVLNAVEITSDTDEIEDETLVKFLNMDQTNKESEACENESDEEMNHEPSFNAEEERESAELEEALQRSLLEF
ncbi:E3 SUMO-protein ligase ZNF451 [Cottoperca gobio]|uniref:E3 SUMO-protein ligase ZNF451 n=1 Tax=Cottoperca gobio TaxID=56716 RepID=A0A6J2R6K6_COTGO|nr:E3 SUMO-protein ligase ZNF451 [Cottoperca gobio]XP_029305136.1 E3 SUMO-protein ligase ZNF451 [Cottoperca gobio]XP_029305137.1 E3 SUMO-protein ligase ZNF451 [Cottoperca gobio]